jgi:hypothetical protein
MEKTEKTTNPFDVLFKELKDSGLEPQVFETPNGQTGYIIEFGGEIYEGGIFQILEDKSHRIVVFYVDFAEAAPKSRYEETVEYITRANSGIYVGNFEFNYANGSIRYQVGLDFQDDELSPALVRNLITAARDAAETYAASLIEVIKGEKTARKAIEEAES